MSNKTTHVHITRM